MARHLGQISNAAFEKLLLQTTKKLMRLRAVAKGDASFKKVWRQGHPVKAHKVKGHWVRIVQTKKKP